jgi:hypothetical protein
MLGKIPTRLPDSGKSIKSNAQSGVHLMTATSESVLINPVNTEKSIVIIYCASEPDGTYGEVPENVTVKGSLTNSTTLALTRDNNNCDVYVYWQVVECYNVKSLQTGSKSITGVTNTATVNPVDPGKCLLFVSFSSVRSADAHSSFGAYLSNSTTISFRCYLNQTTNIFNWQLIEFK